MIERVSACIEIPLVIGGGIQNPEKVYLNAKAGADLIVVGNAIEKDPSLLTKWRCCAVIARVGVSGR